MRTPLVLLSLLLCGLRIAGYTSSPNTTTASTPTTQALTTDTSAPVSITLADIEMIKPALESPTSSPENVNAYPKRDRVHSCDLFTT
ncbi:hypothetical protein [Methanosphaerula palustris]|uniref:Uncharacterized protein n=1 Tax=Methanosphaerula palustris (strain ATCC BAA-1556 / DSM 19958 / E1-9c) TaxID=521011 RepID=B8GI25_METPE|nr:hypothetical protein [Methanosphaerula palustris]ACL16765.1 hypothetical protein Mpal_1441 [Methanosphaerula palustris E1-9c]